jgi:DNA invertase Pin-like site-specific DNA recombinase
MINTSFDPSRPYRYVRYARMSSDQQNPRSPEQQFQTIDDTLKRCGYRWNHVKDYRDDAKSGKYIRKRPSFQEMLLEIRSDTLKVDLIVVDTLERFGRMEELDTIRRELRNKCGVLILTADTNFADPTSPQGRAFGMVESIRATEDARVKAHNVRRGKRDAAMQGHWPGGKPPFGLRLHSVMSETRGRKEVDHCVLEHDPNSAWIVKLMFKTANEKGFGQTRMARFLNDHPEIPEKFKPFEPATVGYWLDNPIYYGELVWDQHSTDVVDDVRVIQRNEEVVVLRVPNFCAPLIPKELWESVQAVREARREQLARSRNPKSNEEGKQIAPLASGLSLKYTLTGLVRCGRCGRAMTPSPSSPYTTKAGEERRYNKYVCPGYIGRNCPNSERVPMEWLYTTVVDTLSQRLFPNEDGKCEWLPELLADVRNELEHLAGQNVDCRPAWEEELANIQGQVKGWSQTLANPDLDQSVRVVVEGDMKVAIDRKREIETLLSELEQRGVMTDQLADEAAVLQRIDRLDEVLGSQNPTRVNLELSLHIDRIDCYKDGRVDMRTCRLGALPGFRDLLQGSGGESGGVAEAGQTDKIVPRRRARLRTDEPVTGNGELKAAAEFAADPNRFSGLSEDWFWTDTFQIPVKKSWAEEHAEAVFRRRQEARLSFAKLAKEFGVTPPTIRSAIDAYLADHPELKDEVDLPRGGKRPPRFNIEEFAGEARALWKSGWSKLRLAEKYGCSTPVIDKALKLAYEQDGMPMPKDRDRRKVRIASARKMLESGKPLEDIAGDLGVSDATARKYLKESFAAEGKEMPDLQRTGGHR